jgi:protoporphyrinogen/coproporphyrinogen III oxidase
VSDVIIVGGGISGLSAAYYLSQAGIPATLIERRNRLGGVIRTERIEGCTLEAGPDSYLAVKPAATELIREVGLGDDIIGSNDHQRVTFVVRHGRLTPLPDGLMMMVPTKIAPLITTRLLGWGTKFRMGLEYLRRPGAAPAADRSVSEFITDHYGVEALDYLAEPLLSGVYGGDPGKLSALSVLTRFVELETKYGSLTRGVLTSRALAARNRKPGAQQGGGDALFRTLKSGFGTLIDRLRTLTAPHLTVLHETAEAIQPIATGGYRVRVGGETIEARDVVLACPGYQAAALLGEIDTELARVLNQVEYSSSLTLSLGYRRADLGALPGFGFLVPIKERKRLVAMTVVQNKFSHRVAAGKAVLRCFFGGASDEAVLAESDEAIIGAAREELRTLAGVTAEPVFHTIARWPRSMAQYTVGHSARLKQIDAALARLPGLHLAGNAYSGIGIPDCVRTGRDAAQRIAKP